MGEVQLHDTGVESIRSFATKVPSSQRYLSGTTTGSYSTLMMMMMMVMVMMIIMVMMMMMMMMMNMMTMAILITFIFMST